MSSLLRTFFLAGMLLSAFLKAKAADFPYCLDDPLKFYKLPESLHEISGVTEIDSIHVACVQDEDATIFIYNIAQGNVISFFSFGDPGDYEGIARIGEVIYVLRSDGVLFEVSGIRKNKIKVSEHLTGVPAKNNEGLCYDPFEERLLIGCKTKALQGPAHKDKRHIYSFDHIQKKLEDTAFELSVQEIIEKAREYGIKLPHKTNKKTGVKEPWVRLAISAIAVHPLTGDLFVLSAVDSLILVIGKDAQVKSIRTLPQGLPQAEGITFLADGTMIITSEGQDAYPVLVVYGYHS